MLDTYNQQVQPDVACTIRTNINTANHHFVVMEKPDIEQYEPKCSVHPNSHKFEFNPATSIKPMCPTLRATDYKAPHCVHESRYRIRKLTPRECFRLMGVDDADIDKIQASGLSNARQYQCAGNSIVVDVLYHIFRQAFCEEKPKARYIEQTLF